MKGLLDPLIASKIAAFARRRRRLILVRALCAVVTIFLVTMSLLAVVDYLFLLPDEARYVLSGLGYGSALLGGWWSCARLAWRSRDPRDLARLIEQVRPELREDLIAAVELGGEERGDSEEFREILQQSVVRRMQEVEVREILSFRKISAWLWAACGVGALVTALVLAPGLKVDRLLLRAMVPIANLARVSRVKIAILDPHPPERMVPQGDVVAVRVEISGPQDKQPWLEIFPQGKKSGRVKMVPGNGRQFESSIAVGHEPVEFRIRAGGALTRKYTLTTVARPEAISFHKSYRYPQYTGKAPRIVPNENNGDLVELEGTVADLEIEVNQEVSAAKLVIERAGKREEVLLKPGPVPRRFHARVEITASGIYRVHLQAARTGFENKFSPQYEIKSMADLVPRVVIEEPARDLIVPPDEEVALKGTAADDLGLRKVLQAVRINQGDWTERLLTENAGLRATVASLWDLHDLRVQPGDRITTKLVAIDLKGNRAESVPIQLTIAARGFDPRRLVSLAAKEALYEELVKFRDAIRALEAGGDELQRKQALLTALAEADQVEARVKDALRVSRAGREGNDLILVARLVKRMKKDSLQVEDLFRQLLASEEAVAALNDMKEIVRDQQEIQRQDPRGHERLARRQSVSMAQVETVVNLLGALAPKAKDSHGKQVTQLQEALKQAKPSVEAGLGSLHGIEQDLALRAGKARENLEKKSEPSFTDVRAASREIQEVSRWKAARVQIEGRAAVEECRKDSDQFFVSDSALAARALQAALDGHLAQPEAAKARETLAIIEKAYRTLETGHLLAELSTSLRELAEEDRWRGSTPDAVTRAPKDWQWMEARMRDLTGEFKEALKDPVQSWRGPAGDAVRREMNERHVPNRQPQSVATHLELLGGDLTKALTLIQPAMDEARVALLKLVPSLTERLEILSRALEKIQQKTNALAARVPRSEAGAVKSEARALLENQRDLDKQIEEVMAEIGRDANVQDLFSEEGRERARDGDDAVAMLQQSPPKAEQLLSEAAANPQPAAQEHALDQAAGQQGRLAEALKTVAGHFKNRQSEIRAVLRKAEEALGIKDKLDKQYAQMERLAETDRQSPEALEEALSGDEAMKREFQRLTQDALDRAEAALNQAAREEQKAAQNPRKQIPVEQARKIAEEARRMAKKEIAPAAQKELNEGAAAVPQNFSDSEQAAQGLDHAAEKLDRVAAQLAQKARQLAHQVRQVAQANEQQQLQVGRMVQGAQGDLQRAARNEQALGDVPQSQALGRIAEGVQAVNQNEVSQAAQAARSGSPQKAAQAAQVAIEAQAQALARARGGRPAEGLSAEGSPLAEEAARFMAQALDLLKEKPGEAAQAMAAAAQAQASAMRHGRSQGQGTPGMGKGSSGPLREGLLPPNVLLKQGDWGKLPPKLASDLLEAQRESFSGEYRHSVESYFRVIAEKAKK